MNPDQPVQFVKGIGPARAKALQKSGINTVLDLLLRLPIRYEDRRRMVRIADLKPGMRTAVSGTIVIAGLRRARRMTLYEIRLDDGSGRVKALWFNQPFLADILTRGRRVVLFGSVEADEFGGRYVMMPSPEHELIDEDDAAVHSGRVVPVYEKIGPLTGKVLRRMMATLAADVAGIPDPLPAEVQQRLGVIGRAEALRRVHDPAPDDDVDRLNAARSPGHVRLILEELFLFQLGLALRRRGVKGTRKGIAFEVTDAVRETVKRILPFRLTNAQKRVLREIAEDMQSAEPMNRLLQGDVGAGKTMVALLSMVIALENGFQAAFMAPTEILAEQHFLTLKRLLSRCPYQVELLAAGVKGAARRQALERVATGAAHIAVGTHALIQESVSFHRLGLAVIDEQHRFGVLQREDLIRKGYDADVLVMTATPIPRTLALTAYGDLDVSILDERPPGRLPIRTVHRPSGDRKAIVDLLRREVASGRQAYVVYPLVEESPKLEEVRAATEMCEAWAQALPGVAVGLLHGRLKSAEKEAVMAAFTRNEVQVLVCTTVIEVGVDVPNATVMVIEHAERFGLAQLHQLRGRVGRGGGASTCVLVSYGKLSADGQARLDVMVQTEDGFVIAEKDLEIRGPGDFFGTRQWGLPTLRVADLLRDRDLLEQARVEAFRVAADAPDAALLQFIESGGWQRRFGLAEVV